MTRRACARSIPPLLGAAALSVLGATAVHAQNNRLDSTVVRPTSSRGRLPVTGCSGQRINNIVIITQPPYAERLPRGADFLRRAARLLHSTTRDDIVSRYLLVRVGDACNQIRRAESERILRAQPFLVDARINVFEEEDGGVRLEVETRDDFSLVASPLLRAQNPKFRGMRLGDGNIGGSAKRVALEWREGFAYADVLGVQYSDYQFGGARNELRMVARRTERGQEMRLEIVRPYYTDLQRFAWLSTVGGTRDFTELLRPGMDRNAVNVTRQFASIGAVGRVGPVGRLRLVGALFTREHRKADSLPRLITPEGFQVDTMGAAPVTWEAQQVSRMNLLLGMRRLRFERVLGFDALNGAQDVRVGVQTGMVLGQSIGFLNGRDSDRFISADLYAGFGNQQSFVGLQAVNESRYDRDVGSWDSHVVSGRLAWYLRPATRQLTLTEVQFSGGYGMRVPFQLSLGDLDGGVLGYRRSREPGAQRVVLRAEQRLVIPTRYNVADVGLAAFVEAGKLWASPTVPYSVNTPFRSSVGVSILAAVPPRSRRLWRLDFAIPAGTDPDRKFEVRLSSADRTRVFWQEPRDVVGARERTNPASLFRWP